MYWKLLRFDPQHLTTWSGFIRLLHKPCDPSLLGYLRIAFGILMLIDIPQERGMCSADKNFESTDYYCQFPYFHFLQPLSVDGMMFVYLILLLGSIGILLGFLYRLSCFVFVISYWYLFMLNKTHWNNHSYLYGVIGVYFLLVDAHRYASVDGLLNKKLGNSTVPQWMYMIIRFQIFIVYFLAGVKKTDLDWQQGYSMTNLSRHWVFEPFRVLGLDNDFLDLFMVHKFGFILDLTIGFWLFWDKTRIFAFVFCGSFHLMNSQIFSIGMFPYAMLATMFVFCKADSFKKLITRLPHFMQIFDTSLPQENQNCSSSSKSAPSWKQIFSTIIAIMWIAEQLFLPFSHFITLGYNGWTDGPYGYSWDMMVQNTNTQHIKISYIDRDGNQGFLQPNAFLKTRRDRWSTHPDHAVQYARCLKNRLLERGVEKPKVYFDVWKSLNKRFMQRIFDPRVDIASYDWSPFKKATFIMPVLTELSSWREKLKELKNDYRDNYANTIFIADFPGLYLENFVDKNHTTVVIELLKGEIRIDHVISVTEDGEEIRQNTTLSSPGDKLQVPDQHFHYVHTISNEPSCYFYSYTLKNTTIEELNKIEKSPRPAPTVSLKTFTEFVVIKAVMLRRGYSLLKYAFLHQIYGHPTSKEEFLQEKRDIDRWLQRADDERKWIDAFETTTPPAETPNEEKAENSQVKGNDHTEL